jgi:hypothetical protein
MLLTTQYNLLINAIKILKHNVILSLDIYLQTSKNIFI